MTQEELLKAINDAGLTPGDLTLVLSFAAALVKREQLKSGMAKVRAAQNDAHQAAEAQLQALQQQIDAIEAQLAAQA